MRKLVIFALLCCIPILCLGLPASAAEKQIGVSCSSDQNSADWDTIAQCVSGVFVRAPYFLGTSSDTCASGIAGLMSYNSGNVKLCNGSLWTNLSGSPILGSRFNLTNPSIDGDVTTGFWGDGGTGYGDVYASVLGGNVFQAYGSQNYYTAIWSVAIAIGTGASASGTGSLGVAGGAIVGSYSNPVSTGNMVVTGTVGVGTSPPSGIVLDASGYTDGLGLPRGTTAQRPTCNAALAGAMRFNTDTHTIEYCNDFTVAWTTITSQGNVNPVCGTSGSFSSAQLTTLTVASGCTVIFKVWGAAGGSNSVGTEYGGGGGYATIKLGPLASNTTYYLAIGGGGARGQGVTSGSYSQGGSSVQGFQGGWGYSSNNLSGGGGGASGVWTGNYGGTAVVIAGGGGGASSLGNGFPGGIGTQTSGAVGATATVSGTGGGGGGYSTGGAAGTAITIGGSGGSSYAATGGGAFASNNLGGVYTVWGQPANSSDADKPYQAGLGTSSSNGHDGGIYYKTY